MEGRQGGEKEGKEERKKEGRRRKGRKEDMIYEMFDNMSKFIVIMFLPLNQQL